MTDFLSFTLRQHSTHPQFYFIEAKQRANVPHRDYETPFRAQWRELTDWCKDNGYKLVKAINVPDDPEGGTFNVVECSPVEAAAFMLRWR